MPFFQVYQEDIKQRGRGPPRGLERLQAHGQHRHQRPEIRGQEVEVRRKYYA